MGKASDSEGFARTSDTTLQCFLKPSFMRNLQKGGMIWTNSSLYAGLKLCRWYFAVFLLLRSFRFCCCLSSKVPVGVLQGSTGSAGFHRFRVEYPRCERWLRALSRFSNHKSSPCLRGIQDTTRQALTRSTSRPFYDVSRHQVTDTFCPMWVRVKMKPGFSQLFYLPGLHVAYF